MHSGRLSYMNLDTSRIFSTICNLNEMQYLLGLVLGARTSDTRRHTRYKGEIFAIICVCLFKLLFVFFILFATTCGE